MDDTTKLARVEQAFAAEIRKRSALEADNARLREAPQTALDHEDASALDYEPEPWVAAARAALEQKP